MELCHKKPFVSSCQCIFEFYSCFSMYQKPILFYCWTIFHCTDMSHFLSHSLADGYLNCIQSFWHLWITPFWMFLHLYVNGYLHFSSTSRSRNIQLNDKSTKWLSQVAVLFTFPLTTCESWSCHLCHTGCCQSFSLELLWYLTVIFLREINIPQGLTMLSGFHSVS